MGTGIFGSHQTKIYEVANFKQKALDKINIKFRQKKSNFKNNQILRIKANVPKKFRK